MSLIECAQSLHVPMGFKFRLASTDARVQLVSGVRVTAAEIHCLAPPVRRIQRQAAPSWRYQRDAPGVEVALRAIEYPSDLRVFWIRTAGVYGRRRLFDACNGVGAVQIPHAQQFMRPA